MEFKPEDIQCIHGLLIVLKRFGIRFNFTVVSVYENQPIQILGQYLPTYFSEPISYLLETTEATNG